MEDDRKRHCWECLRRSLVCDFTRPGCNRCAASGIDCPGYDERQPVRLKWLPPGKVKSRSRNGTDRQQKGSMVKGSASKPTDLIIPPHLEVDSELRVLVQAVEYYNTNIYPDFQPTHDLIPNKTYYPLSPMHFQMGLPMPDHVKLGIVCMALSHHGSRTSGNPESTALTTTFHRCRGKMIRSLIDAIHSEKGRTSDIAIAGMLTLLLAEVHHGTSSHWRLHLEGVRKLILMRGGAHSVIKSVGIAPLLSLFVFVTVMGDTTSPASDMAMTTSQVKDIYFLLEKYGSSPFAFQGCPAPVFAEIIKTSHLRLLASQHISREKDLTQDAYAVLSRINTFSPEEWAETKPQSKETWLLLGTIHQVAASIYCISSLQSVSILPRTTVLQRSRATHSQILQALLAEAIKSPPAKRFIFWALVVLGVEAVHGDDTMRTFVHESLAEMSRWLGTYAPMTAIEALHRFWESGRMHWDTCFDRPYVFATQLMANVGQV